MADEFDLIHLSNYTTDLPQSYPLWYFINDCVIIFGNVIGISVACLFIFTIIRLDHPSYSISNLIACNTCVAIGLTSLMMLFNASHALKSNFQGFAAPDSTCVVRGTLLTLFTFNMYCSLCLKAFNRLRCIVQHTRPLFHSIQTLISLILLQWLVIIPMVLGIRFTNGIDYDAGSHQCLVPITKTKQFIFMSMFRFVPSISPETDKDGSNYILVSIYYFSVLFISGVYFYILYFVLHLSLMERYRRKRQFALLRRILLLLIMLIIPGFFSTYILIRWFVVGSIPTYSFKINSLFDTISHTGLVLTIFISHTKIRRQYYRRTTIPPVVQLRKIPTENCELIVLKTHLHSWNVQKSCDNPK